MAHGQSRYTVTLDFAALWETTNALVIRRRALEAILVRTNDELTKRVLVGTLGHLEDAERTCRDALDIPAPHFEGWTEPELREAFGR